MPDLEEYALILAQIGQMKQGFSLLPVYQSIDEQLHRRDYCNGRIGYRMITGRQWIPSWAYRRIYNSSTISNIYLVNIITEEKINITANFPGNGIVLQNFPDENFELVAFNAYNPMTYTMNEGYYYLEIEDFTGTRYTELFQVKSDLDVGKIKNLYAKYKSKQSYDDPLLLTNLAGNYCNENYTVMLYGFAEFDGFGWMAFESEMGTPEYTKEEEGTTNADGVFIFDFQKAGKKYNLTELVPEHIADALAGYFLADYTLLIPKRGEVVEVNEIEFKPSWQDDGCDALVEINFVSNYITKRQCTEEVDESETRFM